MGSCSCGCMLGPGPVLLPVGPPSEVHGGAAGAECLLADTSLQWGLAPFLLRWTQGPSPQDGDPVPLRPLPVPAAVVLTLADGPAVDDLQSGLVPLESTGVVLKCVSCHRKLNGKEFPCLC